MKQRNDQPSSRYRSLGFARLTLRSTWQLLALTGAACLLNYVWLSFNKTPPHWDSANHLMSALNYRQVFSDLFHGSFGGHGGAVNFLRRLVHVDVYVYPPLFPLTASLVSPSPSLRSLVMMNCLFLAILIYSVYEIGRRLHSHLAGILSAVLVLAYPIAFTLSREFMVDYALLAITALSGFLLLASDEFRSPRETYLFGISAGLGMLTKPTYASFIVVPACYALAGAVARAAPPRDRAVQLRVLTRLALALLLGGLLAALWYIPNFEGVRSEATRIAASNPIGFDVFDVNALVYYLNILMIDQIGLPFTALLIFGLFVLRKRLVPKDAGFLLAWLIGLYVLATLAPYKGTGQDIGILVPISVISAVALAGLTGFRKTACSATLVFAAVQFVVLSLPFPVLGERIGAFQWAVHYQRFPSGEDWQIEKALMSLGRHPLTIAVMSDHMFINGNTVEYYARSLGLLLRVRGRYWGPNVERLLESDAILAKSDWVPSGPTRGMTLRGVDTSSVGVIYTTGRCDFRDKPNEPLTNLLSMRDRELEARSERLRNRRLSRKFPLPDGSELLVYR